MDIANNMAGSSSLEPAFAQAVQSILLGALLAAQDDQTQAQQPLQIMFLMVG